MGTVSFGGDKNALKLTVKMASNTVNTVKQTNKQTLSCTFKWMD